MASPTQQIILQNCKSALREIERRLSTNGVSTTADLKPMLTAALSSLRVETNASKGSSSATGSSHNGSGNMFATLLLRDNSVLGVLLSSLMWNKRKVTDLSLTALRTLFPCPAFSASAHVILYRHLTVSTSSSSSGAASGPAAYHCRCGEALFIALSHVLSNAAESSVQLRAVQFIQKLLGGEVGRHHLTGRAVPDTIGACFTMALQSSQESVRQQCRHALSLSLQRVTRTFVLEAATPPGAVQTFATTTILENYTVDVEHDAPFQPIQVVDSTTMTGGATAAATATSATASGPTTTAVAPASPAEAAGGPGAQDSSPVFPGDTLDPNAIFPRSEDETLVGLANAVLDDKDCLPAPLKDFIVILKHSCRLASLPCAGSVSDSNADIRARELGLDMLERILKDLPVANSPSEHPCAVWLALALTSCRYNLMRCLTLNLSSIQPFSFFSSAVHIITQLFRKFHYHLARELNSLLSIFLIPVVGSRYASFQQKHAVVTMIHTLFSVPHIIISFLTNYDCNPSFDAGGQEGGMLEQLIDFLVEMSFMDYSAVGQGSLISSPTATNPSASSAAADVRGPLTTDQETLLRCECLISIHALVNSLYRWTTEDPKVYVLSYIQQAHQHATQANTEMKASAELANRLAVPSPTPAHGSRDHHSDPAHAAHRTPAVTTGWSELYLDNWESSDDEAAPDNHQSGPTMTATPNSPAANADSVNAGEAVSVVGTESSVSRNMSFVVTGSKGAAPTPLWGKHRDVFYHWKHVHFMWHNKRILQEAVSLTNSGKWKEALNFLVDRCVLPQVTTPEEASTQEMPATAGENGAGGEDASNADTTATNDKNEQDGEKAGDETKADQAAEDEDEEDKEDEDDDDKFVPGTTPYAPFARFLHDFPGIERDAICRVFERVNKDVANKQVLLEYLHLFDYRGVPVDLALRDTTCKFMSWDRPMFEAGVWAAIQRLFGREYARQNLGSITASDADTMAGVLLFLHANLHNDNAKGARMSCKSFASDGNACLDFPMEERDIVAMYERVAKHKWELDSFGRTPQQQEAAKGDLTRLSTKIRYERAVTRSAEQLTRDLQRLVSEQMEAENAEAKGAADDSGTFASKEAAPMLQRVDQSVLKEVLRDVRHQGAGPNSGASFVSPTPAAPGHDDIGYLDSSVPNYCEVRDSLRLREAFQQQFVEVAFAQLAKLESRHRQFFCRGDHYHPQPYIVPYYAEHVKLILISAYPQIASCLYMGFRTLDESPIRRQLSDTLNLLFDLAAAFVMNLGDLREVVDETTQRYLSEEQAYRLYPPSRPTLIPFFLNYI